MICALQTRVRTVFERAGILSHEQKNRKEKHGAFVDPHVFSDSKTGVVLFDHLANAVDAIEHQLKNDSVHLEYPLWSTDDTSIGRAS